MHENILQSAFQARYGGVSTMGNNMFPHGTSGHPLTSHPAAQTTERGQHSTDKETFPVLSFPFSPVTPGAGNVTHNITRMLAERHVNHLQEKSPEANRYTDCRTPDLTAFPHTTIENNNKDVEAEVGSESHDHLRTTDSSLTDCSMSTLESISPSSSRSTASPSGSAGASPRSEETSNIDDDTDQKKNKRKLVRTCYTNEQIQKLMRIFHENPYPDSEQMEDIASEFGVADNKIKIWFQNKRARWRRRVNDSTNSYPQGLMPAMMSPVSSYGYMAPAHMMAASSPQMAGYFNYPWMQPGATSPNNNTASQLPFNPAYMRLPATTLNSLHLSAHYPSIAMTAGSATTSTAGRQVNTSTTSPQYPTTTPSPNNNSYLSTTAMATTRTSPGQPGLVPPNQRLAQYTGYSAAGHVGGQHLRC